VGPVVESCDSESASKQAMKGFSVVVPLHNEAGSVDRLLSALSGAKQVLDVPAFEVVLVDDGSTDRTWDLLANEQPFSVQRVQMGRRSGQSLAIARGIEVARYDLIGIMDGDLQTSPDDFALLLAKMDDGFDCVVGNRVHRNDSVGRKLVTGMARRVLKMVFSVPVSETATTLMVLNKSSFLKLRLVSNFHRYLPVLFFIQGYRVLEVPVRHFRRQADCSKYGVLNRIPVFCMDICQLMLIQAEVWIRRKGIGVTVD